MTYFGEHFEVCMGDLLENPYEEENFEARLSMPRWKYNLWFAFKSVEIWIKDLVA